MDPIQGHDLEEPRAFFHTRASRCIRLRDDTAYWSAQHEPNVLGSLTLTGSRRVELCQMCFGRRQARLCRVLGELHLELTLGRQSPRRHQSLNPGPLGPGELQSITGFGHVELEDPPNSRRVARALRTDPPVAVLGETQCSRDGQDTGKTEKAIERLLARARSQFKRRWVED